MKSEDFMSRDNNRQAAIDKLIIYCTDNSLSYMYDGTTFHVELPVVEPLPTATHLTPPSHRRKKFDISTWGEGKGYDETDPDNPDNFKITEGTI